MRISDWSSDVCSSDPRQLSGLYRMSRIGFVTPLRDGMNLVAKEYVAAQDPNDPGVLVLSRFAGSGKQMQAALIVNPYDTEGVAERLQTARHMSVEERRERYRELMQGLVESNVERRSEARRVGKEGVSTCRSRGSPYH